MQIVLAKDAIMDSSHSFLLSDLPIEIGEKFTIIVMRDNPPTASKPKRKVFAHRFVADDITLPAREDLYDR